MSDSEQDKNLYYDSLNTIEKEKITNKLEKEVLGIDERWTCFCIPMCYYIYDAMFNVSYISTPTVLLDNLEMIENFYKNKADIKEDPRFFFSGGDSEKIAKYNNLILENNQVEEESIDHRSLGIACIRYIKDNVLFLKGKIYKVFVAVYEDEREDKDFYVKRLPFIVYQRSLLKYLLKLSKLSKNVDHNKWGAVIFDKDYYDNTDNQINTRIFKDLSNTEYDIVDLAFYE
ncbi:hypothetical protein A0H76_543 [Hepatospora eriocheir]|uniref:Uncharacterized protein n=1 Tax=Hepatospora eriocheir TaxID=1081669 RepID=A0A1X0QIT0_9MICR|nr:hypothetical protein A0H76_543 [Hepatospora eriocheir]